MSSCSRAESKIGLKGLPAKSGRWPTAVWTAPTSVPLPGAIPASRGMVQSWFVAIQMAPAWMAKAAWARYSQPTLGLKP